MSDKGEHTAKWADWPDNKKTAEGIEWAEVGPRPDVDERLYEIVDGDEVDGVIEQVAVPRDLETARANLMAAVTATAARLKYDAVIDVGGIAVPVGEKTLGLLGIAGRKPKASRNMVIHGQRVTLSDAQVGDIEQAIADHIDAVNEREFILIESIEAAATFEDLLAVDVDAGWPAVVD